jgi:hypothetical protein
MEKILFQVDDQEEVVVIEASAPKLVGGAWQLFISRYYSGCFHTQLGKLVFTPNVPYPTRRNPNPRHLPGWFTMAEIGIVLNMIEEATSQK